MLWSLLTLILAFDIYGRNVPRKKTEDHNADCRFSLLRCLDFASQYRRDPTVSLAVGVL